MKKLLLLLAIITIALVGFQAPVMSNPNNTCKHVYAYCMDEGFDMEAVHDRIIETGLRDIAIGVQLYNIIDNQGNPSVTITELRAEIDWAKKVAKGNGSVGLVVYNESTRVWYDFDGIYRYYRDWDERLPVMEAIVESGIDYYLIDLGGFHYSSFKDMTTYLLAMKGILGDIDFGVYDGDAARDMLDYEVLEQAGIYVWSDVFIDVYVEPIEAYLNSPCGWDYDHLILCSYLSPSPLCQPDSAEEMELIHQLMEEHSFKGLNIICTYMYDGIMPEWVTIWD